MQRFDAELVDEFMIDRPSADELYDNGGEHPEPPDPESWLGEYRRRHTGHLAWEARRSSYESFPVRSFDPASIRGAPDNAPLPPPVETIRLSGQRPGRNDGCWCGSGKKYKKCHMRQDDAAGARP